MNVHINSYSERLIQEQLDHGVYRSPEEVIERALERLSQQEQVSARVDAAEFEAALDALAQGSERLPVLPADATTRAGIYQHHD